jgi:hypothetical protein
VLRSLKKKNRPRPREAPGPRPQRSPVPFLAGFGVWCIMHYVHTNHTTHHTPPAAQKAATDAFNGFLAPPVTQKSGMQHWRRSQRPIWGRGRELAPSRLQPPTRGVRTEFDRRLARRSRRRPPGGAAATTHVRGGGGCNASWGKAGRGGAACWVSPDVHPRARPLLPVPTAAMGQL